MRDAQNTPTIRPVLAVVATATDPMLGSAVPHRWFDGTTVWDVDQNGAKSAVGGLPVTPVSKQTTTATPGQIGSNIAVADGKCITVECYIQAIKSDKSQGAAYVLRASFRRSGGTLYQVGADEIDYTQEDDATWGGPSSAISGTNIQIKVAGKSTTTINWTGSIEVIGA